MKVAYLVNQYPKVSHSFIRREILALERQGIAVLRVAVRGWDAELADAEDIRERARTHFVLRGGLAGLAWAVLATAMRAPRRLLAALLVAVKAGRRADRPLPYHLAYLAEACCIVPWLKAFGATHLHAHFGTNSAEVAMLVHLLCGVPYSFTVHGPDEFDKPEQLGLAEKIRRAAFVVAVSSFGRSQMFRWLEQEHWPKVKIVHCGLEKEFHQDAAAGVTDKPRLVCVGRLSPQKGPLILVEAAAALAREHVEFELVFAGDGELRERVEAGIAHHGLAGQVTITGWISAARVREEIQAAKALVLPTFAEGLPVVIMEAMALRRPVLTTYIAGIPELVVHGENGWLIPAGAVKELAAAMRACLTTPVEVLALMGNRARERVLQRHDVDLGAARLAAHFRAAASPQPDHATA